MQTRKQHWRKSFDRWEGSIRAPAGAGGRARRDVDRASVRRRTGLAAETVYHQPDRIVPVDGAAGGAKRKRWREGNQPAERTRESISPSAEGGQPSRSGFRFAIHAPRCRDGESRDGCISAPYRRDWPQTRGAGKTRPHSFARAKPDPPHKVIRRHFELPARSIHARRQPAQLGLAILAQEGPRLPLGSALRKRDTALVCLEPTVSFI
jgi:hypothetical protein